MYDAMTTDRPYRTAVSHEIAVEEIIRQSGVQFDPDIVKAFLDLCNRPGTALQPEKVKG